MVKADSEVFSIVFNHLLDWEQGSNEDCGVLRAFVSDNPVAAAILAAQQV